MKLRILNVIPDTIVDGPGLRTAIYFAGCKHHCKGCHNPESWDMNGGQEMTIQELIDKVKEFDNNKVTLSGGDPMFQSGGLLELVKELKKQIPGINIWLYTGFVGEQLMINAYAKERTLEDEQRYETINYIDTLVDGPFIEEKKNENLKFRGSSNQRVIPIKNIVTVGVRRNFGTRAILNGNCTREYFNKMENINELSKGSH